jgi:predicted enzyme related to lactoylglutathione lyase
MITGMHTIVYGEDADKVRSFFKDVLGLSSVDAGHGWLIFAAPPTEIAAHPTEPGSPGKHEIYLMCDDVEKTVAELTAKGVEFTAPITEERWGRLTELRIPGGGKMGLYQPKHPLAHGG